MQNQIGARAKRMLQAEGHLQSGEERMRTAAHPRGTSGLTIGGNKPAFASSTGGMYWPSKLRMRDHSDM